MDYLPFGDLLSKLGHDRDDVAQRFTGASFDKSAGLYYFNFRFYDSELGRFVSPDPFKGVLENPEELNRYSYVANNPLTLIDPMGLSDVDPNQVDPPPDVTFKDVAKDPITTFRMKVTIPDKKAPPTDGNDETDDSGASNKQTDEKLKSGADRQWVGLVGINWVGGVGSARVSNTISGGIACCKSFTFMGPFFTEAHSDESAANLVYAGASIAPVVIVGYGQPSGYLGQSTYGSVAWGAGPLAVAPVSGYEKSTNKSLTTVGLSLRGIGYEFGASAGVSNTVTVRSVVEGAIMDFLVGVDNALWGYATGPFSTIGRPINRY